MHLRTALALADKPTQRQREQDMCRNETLTITALTFIIGALAMSWPFMAVGLTFEDALFETVSGVSTRKSRPSEMTLQVGFASQTRHNFRRWYKGSWRVSAVDLQSPRDFAEMSFINNSLLSLLISHGKLMLSQLGRNLDH